MQAKSWMNSIPCPAIIKSTINITTAGNIRARLLLGAATWVSGTTVQSPSGWSVPEEVDAATSGGRIRGSSETSLAQWIYSRFLDLPESLNGLPDSTRANGAVRDEKNLEKPAEPATPSPKPSAPGSQPLGHRQ